MDIEKTPIERDVMAKEIIINTGFAKVRVIPKKKLSKDFVDEMKELLKKYDDDERIEGEVVMKLLRKEFKDQDTIGFNVRGYRYRLDMTQKDLARKAKIAQGDLSKIENNKLKPGVKVAKKLGKALKCDYKKFL